MALDSIYKFREVKNPAEVKTHHDVKDMKRLIDSLPTMDMDQEWVKEHEVKRKQFFYTNSKKMKMNKQ